MMRKTVPVAGILGAVLLGLTMACAMPASVDAGPAEPPAVSQSADTAVEGSVLAMASSVRHVEGEPEQPPSVSLVLRTEGGIVNVTLAEGAQVTIAGGSNIAANEIPLSATVRAEGRRVSPTQFEATSVEVLP